MLQENPEVLNNISLKLEMKCCERIAGKKEEKVITSRYKS